MQRQVHLVLALCLGCREAAQDVPEAEPGAAVPFVSEQLLEARRATACVDAWQLQQAIEMYQVQERGACPPTLAALEAAGIVARVRADPWGEPFAFRCSQDDASVSSPGPDRKPGTSDDVSTSEPPCAR